MKKNAKFAGNKSALKRTLLINTLKLKKLASTLYRFAFGDEVCDNRTNTDGSISVAAGDPTLSVTPSRDFDSLPDTVQCDKSTIDISEYKKSEKFKLFTVKGFSMSPEDISNGDKLLCRKVDGDEKWVVGEGKFVVIIVDPEYYQFKKKELQFDYKLRHTLYRVPTGSSVEDLIDALKSRSNSIFLKQNQENLRTKYSEAIEFYGDTRELMLSVTYRKGELRYSFHPINLITYVAEYVLKHNGKEWEAKKLE